MTEPFTTANAALSIKDSLTGLSGTHGAAKRPALTPTSDSKPVEKAVVDDIAANFDPETFLWCDFHRADGGVHIWYAWTAGGQQLGDHVDSLAMTGGLDAADWLHIAKRNEQSSSRGRVKIKAYPLRPVLADVQSGIRGTEKQRENLRRLLQKAAEVTGHTPRTLTPRWLGFGPDLTNRKE